jgi:hypothetical protein
MKNNKKTFNKIYISLALLMILSVSCVSAFSVSSPYMENKTLNLFPDSGITDLEFVLQNGGGATENVSIKVSILEGSEIISITNEDDVYAVVPGDKVPVNFRITLPENVTIGDIYNIRLEFKTVSIGQNGEFGFGTGQEQDFQIVVIEEVVPKKEIEPTGILLYLIVGILLVLLIIVMFLSKKKKKPSKK